MELTQETSKPPVGDLDGVKAWLRRAVGGGYLRSFEAPSIPPLEGGFIIKEWWH